MTADHAGLDRSLARTRLCVLGSLAACAAVIFSQDPAPEHSVGRATTAVALAIAVGSIAMRRLGSRPATSPRTSVSFAIAGMLLALGLGALGTVVAVTQSARETGLLLALGGFILALPRPRVAGPAGTHR
jgi:hypothetical protein